MQKYPFPLKWRIFLMQKYPFIPARNFSFIFSNETLCPQIFFKDVRRFSTKHIKCRYLHEINEKSRTGINGCFCIKNPLLWKCPIYSRTEFFIYLFEDFIQRFSNETPCPQIFLKDVRRFSTKHIKCRYLNEIN